MEWTSIDWRKKREDSPNWPIPSYYLSPSTVRYSRKQKSIHRHDSFPVSMNIGERREEGIEGGETPPPSIYLSPLTPLPSLPSFVPPYTHHPFPLLFLFFYSTFVSHSIEYSFSWVCVLYESLHPSSLLSSFLSIVSISSISIRFPFTSHLVK